MSGIDCTLFPNDPSCTATTIIPGEGGIPGRDQGGAGQGMGQGGMGGLDGGDGAMSGISDRSLSDITDVALNPMLGQWAFLLLAAAKTGDAYLRAFRYTPDD